MRKYLISTAAFVLLAAPSAWSDPPSDRGKGNEGHAQAEPSRQSPGGGHFDRGDQGRAPQAMPAPPNRGGQNRDFDRGDHGPAPQAMQAPPNRGGQNRDFDRGDRGRAPQMAVQAPPSRPEPIRGGDRSIGRGGDDRRSFNDNRPDRDVNRDANRAGRTDFNRDGRTDFRPDDRRGANYGGPRHDFSGFRDYHRSFHVSRRFYAQPYRRPAGWYEHRWTFGEFLPPAFWVRDYWLIDFAVYDLPPPPYGAVWVRVGPDALLIDEDTGEIITVAYDVFY